MDSESYFFLETIKLLVEVLLEHFKISQSGPVFKISFFIQNSSLSKNEGGP